MQAKFTDPLAPVTVLVTVLVPNNVAGILARRHLADGLAATGGSAPGIAWLRVSTLTRLAERY